MGSRNRATNMSVAGKTRSHGVRYGFTPVRVLTRTRRAACAGLGIAGKEDDILLAPSERDLRPDGQPRQGSHVGQRGDELSLVESGEAPDRSPQVQDPLEDRGDGRRPGG